jgi:hypothetical protein
MDPEPGMKTQASGLLEGPGSSPCSATGAVHPYHPVLVFFLVLGFELRLCVC